MTSIEKLQIQGIRAYSPYEPQVLEFYKPLTVIVGQNGCGKTTIIECLKQATTGDLPPNCKNGQNFIHDPNLAVTMEVKGQIKLQFRSSDGKPVVCTRSFNLTQRAKKKEYKALESVLTTYNETNKKVTMSTKCSDLNKLVPQLMGVSHAILENVIFCHQEESNWCLGDDATLKKKFDEIFASARYTKAMDEIRKYKNELASVLKDLKKDAEHLETKMQNAQKLKAALATDKAASDALRAKIGAYDAKLHELNDSLDELGRRKAALDALHAARVQLQVQQREKREQVADLCTNLGNQFGKELDEDDEALQRRVDAHTSTQAAHARDEARARGKVAELLSRRATLEAAQGKARDEAARLRAEADVARQQLAERDEAIQQLAPELGGGGALGGQLRAGAPLGDGLVGEFERALAAERGARDAIVRDAREAARAELGALDASATAASLAASGAAAELERAHAALRGAHAELAECEAKSEALAREHTQGSASAGAAPASGGAAQLVVSLCAQRDDAETRLDELRERRERDGLAAKVAAVKKELDECRFQHRRLLDEIESANARSATQAQYEAALATKARRAAEIDGALNNLKDALSAVFDAPRDVRRALYDGSLGRHLRASRDKCKADLAAASASAAEARRETQELGGQLKERETLASTKRREVEAAEAALRAQAPELVDNPAAIEDRIGAASAAVNESERKIGMFGFLPEFVGMARAELGSEHRCKLCQRAVAHGAETDAVDAVYVAIIERGKRAMEEARGLLEGATAELQRLNVLAPACRKLVASRADLTMLEAVRARLREEERAHKADLERADEALKLAHAAHETAAHCVGTVERLAPALADFASAQAEVNRCNEQTDTTGARTQEDVLADVKAKSAQIEAAEARHARLVDDADKADSALRAATTRVSDVKSELQLAQVSLERLQEAEVTLRKLRERVAPLAAEVQRLQSSGQPRQAALAAALAARDEARARHEAAGKDADARARALAARAERFCSLQREVARRAQSGASADLQTALDAERDAGANLASSKREIEGAQKAEADATRALTRAHAAMAELKENLRLRKVREQLGEVDAQLDRLAAKLDQERAADGTSPAELLQGAEHAKASTLAHRAESIGKRAIHGEQIKRTEGELKSAEYKGVDVAHRTKAIDVVAHGLVVKDLDAYYKALDRSLMKFHSKKMEDINATIRELWQRTYQGHDIDSIEIQSEHEGETATGRRIQKYRVMMRRGDTLLDMRGRCSAGQKVLASLIIRLALAETFCLNCGILALDEPTTNLDHANVESFARALNEIIQQRRTQANFQLIVITHDEPFVQLVGRAENADYFYRVYKNEQQYSVVQRVPIADF